MSNQPPPPFGQQPSQPYGPQGQPPPPGYGGQPPGYSNQPPGYGGQPPGYGGGPPPGPGGHGGPPGPKKSKAPLIVGIIAVLFILAGAGGAVLLLTADDDGDVAVADTEGEASAEETSAEETTGTDPTDDTTDDATAGEIDADPSDAGGTEAPGELATPTAGADDQPAPQPTTGTTPPASTGGSSMGMGDAVTGQITESSPTQDFVLEGVAGEEIVLTMIATDDDLDPRLALYGPDGTVVAENDDADGLPSPFDSRVQTALPVDGEYRVEAGSFGQTTGSFELFLDFPSVLTASDTLSADVPEITYDYEGTAGQTIVITMRGLDEDIDPLVHLQDPAGTEIGRDDDGAGFPDSRLEITLPADGTYTIVASTFGSNYGEFEITVAEV